MEKAYIILVHKNPRQLFRLVERLDDDHSEFFIHIDKKVPSSEFENIFHFGSKIHILKRLTTNWGSFDIVEATLNGLKAIKETKRDFKSIILLSGQDYPVKSNSSIDATLTESGNKIFIDFFTLPNYKKWKPDGGMYRVNKYFLGLGFKKRYAAKTLNLLANFFPSVQRKYPGDMTPYAGSQWWIINMDALNYILNYIEINPGFIDFHKHTFAADEVFFQTILMNCKDEQLISKIENNNKRFMKFATAGSAHPEVLTKEDVDNMRSSDALFARKFDAAKDAEVFNLIDNCCLHPDKFIAYA